MAAEQFGNLAATTLSSGVDNAVTTLPVASGAAPFPQAAQFRVVVDSEIMLVTGGAGTTSWTVTRGAESTTAAAHSNGAAVTHVLTAGAIGVTSDPAAAVPGLRTLGSGATQAAGGTDARLSDTRTPTDGTVTDAKIAAGGLTNAAIAAAAAIANTKLATNPLARANHTGTQTMSTISDAGSLATKSAVASADITDGTIVGADLSSSIALPSGATATTQTAGDNSTSVATDAYADAIGDKRPATPLPTTPAFLAETFPRWVVAANAASPGTTGVCVANLIYLRKGMVVSNLNVLIGATIAATATHFWQALTDVSRVMVACTADDTSAASGTVANTMRTQAIATIASGASSTYTVPTSGWYYQIVNSTATTVPTFVQTTATNSAIFALPPIVGGTTDTISTGPPAFAKTFGAIAGGTKVMYGGVS